MSALGEWITKMEKEPIHPINLELFHWISELKFTGSRNMLHDDQPNGCNSKPQMDHQNHQEKVPIHHIDI